MRILRLTDLPDVREGHVLAGTVPGRYLTAGGIGFKDPGHVSHPGRHVHEDEHEVFVILQGRGEIEVDGRRTPIACGDVVVIDPGEDHHLVSSDADPLVNLYLHAGNVRPTERAS